jgi:hypothetical protein
VGNANDSRLSGGTVGVRASAGATIDNFSASVLSLTSPGLPFIDDFSTATNQQLSNNWLNQLGNLQVAGGVATGLGGLDIATINGVSVTNSTVQALVSVAAGQYAGLVSRYSGPGDSNMYWAGLVNSGGSVQLQLWLNLGGNWYGLGSAAVGSGTATVKLVTSGTSLQVFVNGAPALSVTDSNLSTAGTVGIRASAGASIDNFSATSP